MGAAVAALTKKRRARSTDSRGRLSPHKPFPERVIDALGGFEIEFGQGFAVAFPGESLWVRVPAGPGVRRGLPCGCFWRCQRRKQRWRFRISVRSVAWATAPAINGNPHWLPMAVDTSIFYFPSMGR